MAERADAITTVAGAAMKTMLTALFAVTPIVCLTAADRYSVTVKRIEKDLYSVQGGKVIIETRYCYEYAYGDEAILQWEGKYGDNWLLFVNSKAKCDVVNLR